MSDFNLTNEAPDLESNCDFELIKRKANRLLGLVGSAMITGDERWSLVEVVFSKSTIAASYIRLVTDLYEQREREAHLNGKPWEDVA